MSTWNEVAMLLAENGGDQLSGELVILRLQGCTPDRAQTVGVSREVMDPNLEFVLICAVIGKIDELDVESVVQRYGQMLIGGLGYNPDGQEGSKGFLTVMTSIPTALLDLRKPEEFLVYLNIFAQGADRLETELSGSGELDRF